MSLLETYQSRKTLFVNKLTNKGVEASDNDGLTTLINKIDSIDGGSNNGVLLFADKDIVVTDGIVKLGAIALNNGKLVNEPISIIDILYSNSLINDGQNTFDFENESAVGEYSKCESNENGFLLQLNSAYLSSVVFDFTKYKYIISFKAKVLDDEPNICYMSVGTTSSYNYPMSVDVTTTNLPQNISSDQDGFYDIRWEISINNNKIYVNDNLYLNDDDVDYTGFDNHYLWFMSSDWTNIYKNLTITQVFGESEFGATNGIYYGKGIGNKEFIAKCGNVVSQPISIYDTIFYDHAYDGEGNHNDTGWTNARCTLTRDEYTQLVWTGEGNNGTYYRSFTDSADLCIEFDLYFKKNSSSAEIFTIMDNWTVLGSVTKSSLDLVEETWQHIKIEMKDGQGTISTGTSTTPITFTSTGADRFGFSVRHSNDLIRYRDFMVYSA